MAIETITVNNVIKYDEDPSKSIKVNKLLDLQLDVGTLLAIDTNDLDNKKLKTNKDEYFKNLARDNTQILLNAIWELPTDRIENSIVAKLPKPTYILPREKPVPKPKPLTKWQQYAKEKGIQNTKKAKLTWDEILKKWVPRYGYKKNKAEKEKNWIIEVPNNVDPYTDMFEKKATIKQEKVAKNEFQRLRNIAKAKNVKVPSMGLPPTAKLTASQLNTAAQVANVSTASLGKFQPRIRKDKHVNKVSVLQKKKRKLPPPTMTEEYSRNMKIVDSILNKKPKLDLEKAVNREIYQQESAAAQRKRDTKGKKGKRAKGDRKPTGDRKPKGGQGKRQMKKETSGRKRR